MIRVANAPCSWGALEFDLEGEAPGYVQVLDEIAETGYAGTELGDWGFMPTDPREAGPGNPRTESLASGGIRAGVSQRCCLPTRQASKSR